jgi:uncharacterized protein YueI
MTTVNVPCGTWKNPFRICRNRTEDTLCATARKVCQISCSKINEEVSNYITQYNVEINHINSEITVIQLAISSEQLHQSNYIIFRDELSQSFKELTRVQKNGAYLIDNQTKLQQFITENQLETTDINFIIDVAKASNDPEIALLGELLEKARIISRSIDATFNSAKIIATLKLINIVFKTEISRIDREFQSTLQLIIETDKNIRQMDERLNNKTNESASLQSRISEQEARKCTPW